MIKNLPKDLLKYCRKRILIRAIPCVILTAFFAIVLILWGNIIFDISNTVFRASCYFLFMLIPFAVTGVPHKLIDTTYYGKIKKVDLVTTTNSDSSVKPALEHLYFKNTIRLWIETPNGKLIYKKAYSGKAGLGQNLHTYHEGDFVFHLYGTNTVVVLPDASETTVHCAVCGASNQTDNDKCRACGHSLIKSIENTLRD